MSRNCTFHEPKTTTPATPATKHPITITLDHKQLRQLCAYPDNSQPAKVLSFMRQHYKPVAVDISTDHAATICYQTIS